MADAANPRSVVIATSTDLHQKPKARHSHHANSWGTWEELLLASAVQRYGNDNWAVISTELQLRTRASFTITPEACQAKYEAIKIRLGFDEAREEGDCTLWFEELRKLRVAHLKQELKQYDNSIGSLEKKIRRLQSEKTSTKDKSLTLGYGGAIEPKRTPFGTCARGRNVALVESDFSQTHSDLATPAATDASVHTSAQFNKDFTMVQANVGLRLPHAGSGLTLAERRNNKADVVQLNNVGEAPCLDLSQLKSSSDLQATEESTWEKKGDHRVRVLEDVVPGAQIEGVRDTKDGETMQGFVNIEENARGEECNAAETDLKTGTNRDVCWRSRSKQAACTIPSIDYGGESGVQQNILERCPLGIHDDGGSPGLTAPQSLEDLNVKEHGIDKNPGDREFVIGSQADKNECLSSKVEGIPAATARCQSLEWVKNIDNICQHARVVNNVCQDPSTSKNMMATKNVRQDLSTSKNGTAPKDIPQDSSACQVKVEMLTAEDAMSEPATHKLKGGMQTLASRELAVATRQPAKLDSKSHCAGSAENSSPNEVSGESLDIRTELAKRQEIFLARRKIQKLSLSVTEDFDEKGEASVPFTPVESSVKSESITTSNEASDSVHASGSSGGNDDNSEAWRHIERLSGDSRVEKSEPGSLVDGSEDNSPMSKRNKREPKVAGKLIPLLDSLRTVCAHKCAPLFKHSRESQSNRRYHLMIRAPMDLGMIRVKLEEGQYSGSLDFFRDLLLMVSNALVYYSKDCSESAAASGLRECILREMEFIFKTEVLVKQEGPTFRKRDAGKARQLSPGKPGKVMGAQMPVLSTVDMPVQDLALKQCDGSMNVGCQDHQRNSIRPDEGTPMVPVMTDEKDGRSSDAKRLLERDSNKPKGACRSVVSRKASEPGAWGPIKALISAPEFTVRKERLAESLDNNEWSPPKAKTPKSTGGASSKSGDSCIPAPYKTPELLKRGVGRPPKHSHNQDSQRAKEAYNSPRKKFKR